jgi:hypothetical protein
VVLALTPANIAGRATTAHVTVTIMGVAGTIITADPLIRITAPIPVGRPQIGVTAHPGDITRIHTMAVTHTVVTRTMGVIRTEVTTITTRTTRRRPAITDQWLQLCSGVLANSVITTA